ncbi:hypothetical protein [Tomitella biformata]|uniref:hypothetical protein n=1 Tax=Tomitella biformata TaxID=630403 RepID=UPI000464B08B|nr:hypothetical protein [Tomitella biformata]
MIETQQLREARRRREKQARPSGRSWRGRNGLIAVAATAALGAGLLSGGAPAYAADSPFAGLGLEDITGLLENEMIKDFVEICDSPDGSAPAPTDDGEVYAVVDCSQSTGTGIAVVLPGSLEVGAAAEGIKVDLGKDILGFKMGERNLIEIVSAVAIDPFNIPILNFKMNPGKLGRYSSYEQVQTDASLPYVEATRYVNGDCTKSLFGICYKWEQVPVTYDGNLAKRTEALKVAEYLTGQKYDYTKPMDLPGKSEPVGSSTVVGPGMQLALSMTGGTARAETGHEFGIATAGAGEGRTSSSYAYLGMANALNLDTDKIELTWFGKVLDFTNLENSGLLGLAGDEAEDMIGTIEGLEIPALKEVSCFGVLAQATAEGLGSCSNILGTFDSYEDLRAPKVGESRQTQYGLTDVTSLVLGNNALLKQLNGTSEETPFMDTLMENLTSEEGRLKFAKDFVRYTQDVKTEAAMTPELDEDGNAVLDDDGNPVLVPQLDEDGNPVTTTITAAYLTSDYGFVDPITIEWMGQRIVLFPAATVNGEERPNYLSAPQIEKIVADADSGEMSKISMVPKVSLVQWANPFGLGTLTLDKPLNPVHTLRSYFSTVTIVDDVKGVGGLVEGLTGSGSTDDEEDTEQAVEETLKGDSSQTSQRLAVVERAGGDTAADDAGTSATGDAGVSSTPTSTPTATSSDTATSTPTDTPSGTPTGTQSDAGEGPAA